MVVTQFCSAAFSLLQSVQECFAAGRVGAVGFEVGMG